MQISMNLHVKIEWNESMPWDKDLTDEQVDGYLTTEGIIENKKIYKGIIIYSDVETRKIISNIKQTTIK